MTPGFGLASVAAIALLAMVTGPLAANAAQDLLVGHRWRTRVLLVIAPQASDPKLARQRAIYKAMGQGAKERDLELVEAIGDTAQALGLRARFDLNDHTFHALLIGKDGGDKLASDEPLGPDALYPLIDAMPMRQQEIRERS